jgi:hypothetical protein
LTPTEKVQELPEHEQDPMIVFMYALKAPETRRQWPRRLKVFFGFLRLEEPVEEQARQSTQWAQDGLFRFMNFQHERVKQGKISESSVPNYYSQIITKLSSYFVR